MSDAQVYIKEEIKVVEEEDHEVRGDGNEEELARSEAPIPLQASEEEPHNPEHLSMPLDSFASLVEAATIQIIPDIHDPVWRMIFPLEFHCETYKTW